MTSVELMVSIPSAAMLVAGLGACITLMLRSNSKDAIFYQSIQHVADASTQMAMEIEMATAIASVSSTAIEFSVPDRTGDYLPEQIRYEWVLDSKSQGSLYRRMNQGKDIPIITNVNAFNLVCNYSLEPKIPNRFQSESVLLNKVDSILSAEYSEESIDVANNLGVCFRPENESGAKWDLGSLQFMIRSKDPEADGSVRLRVVEVDGKGMPDLSKVFADIEICNRDLSTKFCYFDFPLAPICQWPSNQPLAAILSTSPENPPIRVLCLAHPENVPEQVSLVQSFDQGLNWTRSTDRSPRFLAIGYLAGSSSEKSQRRNLVSVDIFMSETSLTSPTMMVSAKLLAQPEVP
jgi:hypothetical protein